MESMNSHDVRVSVVITSYNQVDYLSEALESVIHQTVRPYEIIIADACSTDGSIGLIQDYVKRYAGWIKGIFQYRNAGNPINRNAGLCHVTGNYVAILGGDDRFVPYKLEREIQALKGNLETTCVYSNVQLINSVGHPMGLRDGENKPSGDIFTYVAQGQFGLPRSMLIEYRLLKDIGFFDERLLNYDGFDLTVQLAARCQFVYLPEPLVDYRVHDMSESTHLKPQAHLHDLEGIYQKLTPLLEALPADEHHYVHQAWEKRLFRWRIFEAIQQRHGVSAAILIWNACFKESIQFKDLMKIIKLALKRETYCSNLLRKA